MSTKNYNQIGIKRFLAKRVDLKNFCFIFKNKYKPEYDYQELEGTIPTQKSESLVDIAASRKELGNLVFHIVKYWLDDSHGEPRVLAQEGLNVELEIFLKELEEQGDIDRAREVRVMIKIILDSLPKQPPHFESNGLTEIGQFEHGYAVLVGAGNHRNPGIPPLPATVKDVQAIGGILSDPIRCGYLEEHIQVLTGPAATYQSILGALDWLAEMAGQDEDATVIFYFSGHGWKDETPGSSRYYLIPYDCDWERVKSTTIVDNLLMKKLRAIETDRLVVILDACHAAGMTLSSSSFLKSFTPHPLPKGFLKAAPPTSFLKRLGSGSGKITLSSSRENEFSYIHVDNSRSIFTDCLIEALSGQASCSHPGQIGITDVFNYLDRHVPTALKTLQYTNPITGKPAQQNPVLDSTQANNFPIALVPGGKGKSLI